MISKKPSFMQLFTLILHAAIITLQIAILTSPNPASFASASWLSVSPVLLGANATSATTTGMGGGDLYTLSVPTQTAIASSTTSISGSIPSSSAASSVITSTSGPVSPTNSLSAQQVTSSGNSSTLNAREQSPTPAGIPNYNSSIASASASSTTGNATSKGNSTTASTLSAATGLNYSDPTLWRSDVHLIYGLLGNCFFSNDSTVGPACTSSSVHPDYDSRGLASYGYAGVGLPTTLSLLPTLYLVDLLLVIALLPGTLLPLLIRCLSHRSRFFDSLSESGAKQRSAHSFQSACNFLLIPLAILLLGCTVALRISAGQAISAFNAANAGKVLPGFAMVDSWDNALPADVTAGINSMHTLRASASGGTYSLSFVTFILTLLLVFLRRRQLRSESAAAQAKTDLEARFGRRVFAKAAEHLETSQPLSPAGRPFPFVRTPSNDLELTQRSGASVSSRRLNKSPSFASTTTAVEPRSPIRSGWPSPRTAFFPSRVGFNTHPATEEMRFDEHDRTIKHAPSLRSLSSSFQQHQEPQQQPQQEQQQQQQQQQYYHAGPYRRPSAGSARPAPSSSQHQGGRWVLTNNY